MTTGKLSTTDPPGFSLIELLVVACLIGILAAFAVPAFSSIAMGNAVTRGGQIIESEFQVARQLAVSLNRDAEVRLIDEGTGEPAFSAMQIWLTDEQGVAVSPEGRVVRLPEGVVIAPGDTLSPLLTAPTGLAGILSNGPLAGKRFVAFRFRANGSVGSGIGSTNGFLTVVRSRDESELPTLYYVVRLAPSSGRISSYQP